ncbi:MAG: glycosyl transferase [Mycoplasmoidaceae bacterium]|nr:MAG: glycosyl transferase [Mycoplasmoidaceae bacterium]
MFIKSAIKKNSKFIRNFIAKGEKLTMSKNDENIIISITSFPPRIEKIHLAIHSIINQTIRPNKIILSLNKDQFNGIKLPESLMELTKIGLEIKWVEKDFKSFNKLYYVLNDYPTDIIIIVDDDSVYKKNLIAELLNAHQAHPDCICANITHKIKNKNNKLRKYSESKWWTQLWEPWFAQKPNFKNFAVGGGGALYKRSFVNDEFFNNANFTKLCPKADDIWFWCMSVYNNTKTCSVKKWMNYKCFYKGKSPCALSITNCAKTGTLTNDVQFVNVIEKYPIIEEKICKKN